MTHQGDLKWFIVAMTEKYAGALKQMGVFKEEQLSKMADAALFSDVIYTIVVGLKHASDVTLDRFYTENEATCTLANEMQRRHHDGGVG